MRPFLALASSSLFLLALAGCSGASSGHSAQPGADGGDTVADAGGNAITVNGQTVPIARSAKPRNKASSVATADVTGAVTASNAFAVDLYSRLRAQSASDNLLTSPISASLALTMTYAGAGGTTATQMATALHYGSAASTIFDGQNALSQALASRAAAALQADTATAQASDQPAPSADNYQLQVVNSVWGEKTYTWQGPFLDIMAEDYGTGVYLVDFIDDYDPSRVLINDWVSDETSNKINNLLPEGSLTSDTRMVLVNAIHLKLPWANTFDASATEPDSFTSAAGTTVSAPFMHQTSTLPYVDDGQAQVVALPLGHSQVAVVIAMPHGDLATYESALTATSAGITVPTGTADVELSLPKASFTSPTFSLKQALKAMGMPVAFGSGADFSGLCPGSNLYIQDVLQKAMIAMQETGVEAAAATAVIIGRHATGTAGPPATPISMTVNRPYVVSIVDVPTGALLFLGHIVDPTQAGGS